VRPVLLEADKNRKDIADAGTLVEASIAKGIDLDEGQQPAQKVDSCSLFKQLAAAREKNSGPKRISHT